jgi:phage terminase small subunit
MVRVLTKEYIKKRTINDMKTLGVYKKEYRDLIDVYVDIQHDYMLARRDFEKSGRQYETETAAGNPKKSAIVDSIEKLRKDIIAYSDRLGLSPKSLESITAEKKERSSLASVLSKLE